MILKEQKEAVVLTKGESQDSIGMSLDLDSAQMLMQMLSKNLYSDPIGSTIRECASNALDSHRRAGVEKPIVVSFGRNSADNYEFSVEDFGTGLDADDVANIISKYGKSTKRQSANELGMMGLGFKAPLAYSSSFYFVCRKDGMERKYMMYEGEDVNTIDLLYDIPTEEANGVKVIVPVKFNDRYTFVTKIKEQLAYFESVYFNVDGISNEFKILRAEHYQISELCSDRNIHICLDNVYYPLDFSKLGGGAIQQINTIRVPIGLRFSLSDGIYPIPNREALKYTQEAKDKIIEKIKLVADDLVEKYNDSVTDTPDINVIFKYYTSNIRSISLDGQYVDITDIIRYSDLKLKAPKLEGIDKLNLKTLTDKKNSILNEYKIKYTVERGTFKTNKAGYYRSNIRFDDINSNSDRHIYYEGQIGGIMKDYLRYVQISTGKTIHLIKKESDFALGNAKSYGNDNYYYLLDLHRHSKSDWRQIIEEFQSIRDMFVNKFEKLDDIQIPQSWLDARKKKGLRISNRRERLEGDILIKEAQTPLKFMDGRYAKFVPLTYKLEEIYKKPYLYVYSKHDDYLKLDALYGISEKQKMKMFTLSQREMKLLEGNDIHNLISFDEFMEGKTKPFQRMVTGYLIFKLMEKYNSTFSNKQLLVGICSSLHNKLGQLHQYAVKNYKQVYAAEELYIEMVKVAEEKDLFDHEIYHLYQEVKAILDRLTFIDTLLNAHLRNNDNVGNNLISIMIDMFRYNKFRMDYEQYNIVLDEDVKSELTEETIEVLTNNN